MKQVDRTRLQHQQQQQQQHGRKEKLQSLQVKENPFHAQPHTHTLSCVVENPHGVAIRQCCFLFGFTRLWTLEKGAFRCRFHCVLVAFFVCVFFRFLVFVVLMLLLFVVFFSLLQNEHTNVIGHTNTDTHKLGSGKVCA